MPLKLFAPKSSSCSMVRTSAYNRPTDLLGLRPDGNAGVLAAGDQLFEEYPIAGQVLLEFLCGDPAKEQVKIAAREKLQDRDRLQEAKAFFKTANRRARGDGPGRSTAANTSWRKRISACSMTSMKSASLDS